MSREIPAPTDPLSTEAPRDQLESSFTPLLRGLLLEFERVLAASFVDPLGECIDYCSRLDPFEAKIAGAQMLIAVDQVRAAVAKVGGGELVGFEIYGDARDMLIRRVDEDCTVVVMMEAGTIEPKIVESLEGVVGALREEAGVLPPPWDPAAGPLEVETRWAVGWEYAPSAYRQGSRVTHVADVLGRWVERGRVDGTELVCFRVRTERGLELTLAHDRTRARWLRW